MKNQNFKTKYDLTIAAGRQEALEFLNTEFVKDLKSGIPELTVKFRARIGTDSVTLQGVDENNELVWASNVQLYAEDREFGRKCPEINFGSTGSFNPENENHANSVIRTEVAYHIINNWELVVNQVNKFVQLREELYSEIEEVTSRKSQ